MGVILPLGAGVGLLAFLGTEGERTDLGAHLFGFCCGIIAGLLANITGLTEKADNQPLQRILYTFALIIIFTSWWLAARNSTVSLL